MSSMMEYKGYHAKVEYDAEDKIFIGEVFGIVDSLNFHGTTVEELEEMFHQSIENYLSICEQCGKIPDKEFKGTFNVRISTELHRKVALEAAKQGVTLNQYVAKAIEKSLDEPIEQKTVIYIPYSTKSISWDNEQFIPEKNLYVDSFSGITNRREVSYVTN